MEQEFIGALKEKLESMKLELPGFPYMQCIEASDQLYDCFGLLIVRGEYHGIFSEDYRRKAFKFWKGRIPLDFTHVYHDFSYSPSLKLFVDITARQFHNSNPEILFLNGDDIRVALETEEVTPSTTHKVIGKYNLE